MQIVKDFEWASVGSPPTLAQYQRGKPEGSLVEIAAAAWPKGSATLSKDSYSALCREIEDQKLNPVQH